MLRILESDQVAQVVIAKQHPHLTAVLAPHIRLIGDIDAGIVPQRPRQHAVIGRRPRESALRRQRQRLIGDRTLRRPQSRRRDSQLLFHIGSRALQLHLRVVRILKPRGQRHARMRHAGDIGIANQRQNRMIERRGGNLDLSARGELAIHRQHALQRFALLSAPSAPDPRAKNRGLSRQRLNLRIASQQILIEPDQLIEHLQVPQILSRKARCAGRFVQLAIARIAD